MRFELAFALGLLTSCTSVDDYRADSTAPFVGAVLGQTASECDAGTGCSFLRRGFRPGTELVLTFDPSAPGGIAGSLSTRTSDGSPETCGPIFELASLVPVAPLAHDSLSQLTFPGDGRLRTYVFAVETPLGPLATRDAYAFVSLMRGGDVEVRILAGSGEVDCAPDDCASYTAGLCDFFGVFHMKREDASP